MAESFPGHTSMYIHQSGISFWLTASRHDKNHKPIPYKNENLPKFQTFEDNSMETLHFCQ